MVVQKVPYEFDGIALITVQSLHHMTAATKARLYLRGEYVNKLGRAEPSSSLSERKPCLAHQLRMCRLFLRKKISACKALVADHLRLICQPQQNHGQACQINFIFDGEGVLTWKLQRVR